MTVIAYHHDTQTIAVDSRRARGDMIATDDGLKMTSRGDCHFFHYGYGDEHDELIDAYLGKGEIPEELDSGALVLHDGKAFSVGVHEGKICKDLLDFNVAFGAGMQFAIAAMDFGKNAKEAAKYACTRSLSCGGTIRVYDMEGNLIDDEKDGK